MEVNSNNASNILTDSSDNTSRPKKSDGQKKVDNLNLAKNNRSRIKPPTTFSKDKNIEQIDTNTANPKVIKMSYALQKAKLQNQGDSALLKHSIEQTPKGGKRLSNNRKELQQTIQQDAKAKGLEAMQKASARQSEKEKLQNQDGAGAVLIKNRKEQITNSGKAKCNNKDLEKSIRKDAKMQGKTAMEQAAARQQGKENLQNQKSADAVLIKNGKEQTPKGGKRLSNNRKELQQTIQQDAKAKGLEAMQKASARQSEKEKLQNQDGVSLINKPGKPARPSVKITTEAGRAQATKERAKNIKEEGSSQMKAKSAALRNTQRFANTPRNSRNPITGQ